MGKAPKPFTIFASDEELEKEVSRIEEMIAGKRKTQDMHKQVMKEIEAEIKDLQTAKIKTKREIENRKTNRFKESLFKDYLHVLDRETLEKVYEKAKQRAANEQELAEEFGDLLELVL